ncbi:hypothetical protein SAY86_029269 [Trapa natans]|uniref:pyruvate decarboxylase n=1 Tax=Trapa natans TaxID=22666 RepID=A0AAN7MKY4_TRANT|nr:hypothetical protein SAY86_029269 [Trapa natans]
MHRLTERGGELLLALEMGVSRSQHRISLTLLRCGQNSRIFMINNEGHTIEVEIHDGPYNVIKNWNYAGLVDAIHNDEGKCWTKKRETEDGGTKRKLEWQLKRPPSSIIILLILFFFVLLLGGLWLFGQFVVHNSLLPSH